MFVCNNISQRHSCSLVHPSSKQQIKIQGYPLVSLGYWSPEVWRPQAGHHCIGREHKAPGEKGPETCLRVEPPMEFVAQEGRCAMVSNQSQKWVSVDPYSCSLKALKKEPKGNVQYLMGHHLSASRLKCISCCSPQLQETN